MTHLYAGEPIGDLAGVTGAVTWWLVPLIGRKWLRYVSSRVGYRQSLGLLAHDICNNIQVIIRHTHVIVVQQSLISA